MNLHLFHVAQQEDRSLPLAQPLDRFPNQPHLVLGDELLLR